MFYNVLLKIYILFCFYSKYNLFNMFHIHLFSYLTLNNVQWLCSIYLYYMFRWLKFYRFNILHILIVLMINSIFDKIQVQLLLNIKVDQNLDSNLEYISNIYNPIFKSHDIHSLYNLLSLVKVLLYIILYFYLNNVLLYKICIHQIFHIIDSFLLWFVDRLSNALSS